MVEAAEIRERWRTAAPGWVTYGGFVREMTEPVSRAMLERAAPASGERWLDVAGGVGDPALYVARALGDAGRVVVTDLVPEMAAGALGAIRAAVAGTRVDAVAAAGEWMPFAGAFDGLTCRFGVMFFPEPSQALVSLREALAPGGRAVFAVWAERERNAFFREVNAVVRARFPDAPEPDPEEPHPFRFSAAGELPEALRRSGWRRVGEARLPFVMESVLTLDRFWDHLIGLSGELSRLASGLPEEEARALREEIEDRVAPFFKSGSMRFPAEARLAWGWAPRGIRGAT
ncbi:MAG: class I SAM-dependent methyltransferase [Gemmatimonadota bacterium]